MLEHMQLQIMSMGLLILSAYTCGVIARKFNVGEVIGQIFGGMIVGPHFLEVIHRFFEARPNLREIIIFSPFYHFFDSTFAEYTNIFENYHFFVFLFLGLIAFSLGEELHIDRLKTVGIKPALICILQAFLTFILLSSGFYYIFGFSFIHACIIGSIGIATAPALIFILMNKLKIEGSLKNILANIVVLDDIIEVIFFSIFLGAAVAMKKGEALSVLHIGWEVFLELLFAVIIGVAIFIILKLTLKKRLPEEEERISHVEKEFDSFLSTVLSDHPTPSVEVLLIMTGVIAIGIAGAMNFHLPFLITAVVAGFLIANFHSHAIFESMKIRNVMPVLNLFFFALIGANVQIETFSGETIIYVGAYVILRSTGKLVGNWIGCKSTGQDPKITAALPKLMLPQAGMAAVETILVATMLNDAAGTLIFNTIIPALVIFELGGAWLSEKTLMKWKHWTTGERDALIVGKGTDSTSTMLDPYLEGRVIEILAATRDQALFELSKQFVTKNIINDVQVVMQPLLEREKLATTAIGEGVALPHCRTAMVKRTVVCAGICRTPIEWKSPDKKPVDLIFLIITPETDPEQHLAVLKIISKALFEGNLREYLRTVQGQVNHSD